LPAGAAAASLYNIIHLRLDGSAARITQLGGHGHGVQELQVDSARDHLCQARGTGPWPGQGGNVTNIRHHDPSDIDDAGVAEWQEEDEEADCPDTENEEPGKKSLLQYCTILWEVSHSLLTLYNILLNIVIYTKQYCTIL